MSTTVNATTDRIRLVGLSARGHHGVLPFEREEGQLFTVDVTLDLGARGTAVAAVTDSLDDAVDYATVATAVVTVIEGEPVNLLEALADRIAERVLAYPRVLAAQITVHKPQAPLDVAFEDVSVTIYRASQGAAQAAADQTADPSFEPAAEPAAAPVAAAAAPAPEPRRFTSHRAEPVEPAPSEPVRAAGLPVEEAPLPTGESAAQDPWGPDQWMSEVAPQGASAPEPADQGARAVGDEHDGQDRDHGAEGAQDAYPLASEAADRFAAPSRSVPAADASASAFGPEYSATSADAAAFAQDVAGQEGGREDQESAPVESVPTGLPVQLPGEGRHRAEPTVEAGQAPDGRDAVDAVGPVHEPAHSSMDAVPLGAESAPYEREQAHEEADEASGAGLAGRAGQAAAPVTYGVVQQSGTTGGLEEAVESVEAVVEPGSAAVGADPYAPHEGRALAGSDHQAEEASASSMIAPPAALSATSAEHADASAPAAPAVESGADPLSTQAQADPLEQRPGRPVGVVFALGANAGHLLVNLRNAVRSLKASEGIEILQVGPLARSVAVVPEGAEAQPDYLNTVVTALSTLSPRELLAVCQALETDAGRVRTQHWGPRTLDVDLVVVEGVSSQEPELTLPHAHAHERAFVLVPWSQADPFAELGGHTVTELADRAPDRSGLRWLAFDWLDTDNIPEKPTGPYVAPPVADDVPEPVEQVYNATRNERSVMDAELAAEYLAGIGELPPQEAAAKHPVDSGLSGAGQGAAGHEAADPRDQAVPGASAGSAAQAQPGPEAPGMAGVEADNPFAAASFGTDYAVPVEQAEQQAQAPGQVPGQPPVAPGQVPGEFPQQAAQVGEEDSWEAPLQWNEVIGGADGAGPRQGS